MSPRVQIRNWLKTILVDGTEAEDRVFVNRRVPTQEDEQFPVILIYGGEGEDARSSNMSYYNYIRNYQVVVEIRTNSSSPDDALDEIAEEVETILQQAEHNQVFEGFTSFDYTGFNSEVDTEGETEVGSLRMNLNFKYLR